MQTLPQLLGIGAAEGVANLVDEVAAQLPALVKLGRSKGERLPYPTLLVRIGGSHSFLVFDILFLHKRYFSLYTICP